MRACARVALVSMVVSAGLGLAGCASIDELKDTVSRWFASDNLGGHEGVLPDNVTDATDRVPPEKMLREDANKTSKRKDQQARKPQQPQTVERPNKPSASVPAETVTTPQRADAQFTPPQPAPVRLDTPWPQAPSPGTFSR
jgi:hypothetical protein